MEWLNFRHLYAFWSVCRVGGFQRAAKRLHVSQSTISEQVASLEDYLGETLLDRTTRSVTLTERGAALLLYADDIFAKSQSINDIFRDKKDPGASARIRIGLVGGISRNFAFRQILRGMDREPGATFDIVDGSFDELEGMLRTFDLDLLFSLERPRQQHLLTITHRRVASSPICLAGTPDALNPPREPAGREQLLFAFQRSIQGDSIEALATRQLGVPTRVVVRTDDISLLRFLANSGRGVAVMPEVGVREDVEQQRIVTRPLPELEPIEVLAVYLTRGARRSIVDAMLP